MNPNDRQQRLGRRAPPPLVGYGLPIMAGLLALALYASTAAPWLTWAHDGADGGDLITAAMRGGVPHPGGYPTYCLLARLFALLPLGNIARRFTLFSATAAAATVPPVYLCGRHILREVGDDDVAHLGGNESTGAPWHSSGGHTGPPPQQCARVWLQPLIATGIALMWASGHTLWSQAIITEVYALWMLFVAASLYLALHEALLARPWAWALLGGLLGLGSGAHLTTLLMLPGLTVLLWPHITKRRLVSLALGVALGGCVYLYLPWAARRNPLTNWGDPRTWRGFWWLVSGQPYRQYLLGVPLAFLPARLGAWLKLWGQQYTWLGVLASLLGLWTWIAEGRHRQALGTGLIGLVALAHALTYDTADSYVYLLPFYLVSILWMATGFLALLRALFASTRGGERLGLAVGVFVLVGIPLWSLHRHYAALDLHHDDEVASWVDATLQQLPPSSLLITGQDGHTFALDYVQWVEGRRPDVWVVDGELLPYPWYRAQLGRRYSDLALSSPQLTLPQLVADALAERPVYLASPRPELEAHYCVTQRGTLYQLSDCRTPNGDATRTPP